jgi:Zn-dependent peptidase ImmA (M78 family)
MRDESNMKKRNSIEEKAYEVLKTLKINELPIPVDKIANHYNIEIQEEDFEGELSGVLIRSLDGNIIGVNSKHHDNRKRFTIAHELGHFILHKGDAIHIDRGFRVNYRDEHSSLAINLEEVEANAFAAALLMPEKKLKEVIRKKLKEGIDLEDSTELKNLAKTFQVSQQSLLIRLMKLDLIDDF